MLLGVKFLVLGVDLKNVVLRLVPGFYSLFGGHDLESFLLLEDVSEAIHLWPLMSN